MRRKIIRIDEAKCDGCGLCLPNCPEGAIQLIDGKARLISDLFCDGLGACLGHCPQGAITVEEREAGPYDERQVMANVVKQGLSVIHAHLQHLQEHNEQDYLNQAMNFLKENHIAVDLTSPPIPSPAPASTPATLPQPTAGGCPGSRMMSFAPRPAAVVGDATGNRTSQLRHWPIQLHLISPRAAHYQGADLLLAADCVPFALGDFHRDHLQGKALAIACPKLDEGQDTYVEKLTALVDEAKINTLTVIIMEVPCCGGLLRIAKEAVGRAQRKVPIKCILVSLQGNVLSNEWIKF
jgi:ferredoxin